MKPAGPSATEDYMEYAQDVETTVTEFVRDGRVDEAIFVHRGKLNGGGGVFGLGDTYYKVLSEPEEVLQRVYDEGRVGTTILPGDCMDLSPKQQLKPPPSSVSEEEELEFRKQKVMEEIKDKTHRLVVANAIVSSLLHDNPCERYTVVCTLGESPAVADDLTEIVQQSAAA